MANFKCQHCGGEHPEGTESCPVTGEECTPAMLQVGKIIGGKYELIRLLGEGGMGAVYEARHVEIRQKVALKLLHFQLARDPEIRQRFMREAMSAGEIGHENIIEMHDMGRDVTGSIYLVMELLKGESLADRVRRSGALPSDLATDVMLQVLDALSDAHKKGIVHRDMKPENIFLCRIAGRDDFVKILDFGIAKVRDPESGEALTRTGTMLGTSHYMAPEQIAGDKEADHRMDIYACGVIMYQMLVGRVPFDATSVHGVIYKIMNEDPQPLSTQRADLPGGLEDVVKRAMARNPDHRYQSAGDMAAVIAPFGSGRVVFGRGSKLPSVPPAVEVAATAGTAAPTSTPEAQDPGSAATVPPPQEPSQVPSQVAPPASEAPAGPGPGQHVPSGPPVPAVSARAAPPGAGKKKGVSGLTIALIVVPIVLLLGIVAIVVVALGGVAIFRSTDKKELPRVGVVDASTAPDAGAERLLQVEIDTVPSGSSIYVDETFKGTAPLKLELPEGMTAITVKHDGYPTRTVPCKVEEGRDNRCTITLDDATTVAEGADADAATADDVPESEDAPAGMEVTIVDEDGTTEGDEEPPDKKKKKKKKKCDPRKNPKCKFIKRKN